MDSIGRGGTFSWLDIDGDGDLDYLVAGAYFVPGGNGLVEAQIHLYRNDATSANAAPSIPSALSASDLGNGTVQLSWGAATDDSTSADALTYELEITPSTGSMRTAAAAGQQRRLPQPGNVSAVTNSKLRNLPAGTYDWTVRAVDSAFNGGPRASGTFTVSRPPEPIAAIGWPKHGAIVRGRVPIHIGAIDDHDSPAELRVFLLIAGRYFLPTTFNSGLQLFSSVWNTVGIPDGPYQLRALVLDSEGHWGASAPVWVNVDNVP